jgi:4-hydroxy-4-methyl-2-oxoglutarate aldolase
MQPSMESLTAADLEALRRWPTPAIANAIETFGVRPNNQGFMVGPRCIFPELGPMVGFAATATIRAMVKGPADAPRQVIAHWRNLQAQPEPRIAVIQDLDDPPAAASFWGEVNANIHRALGCVGVVTNGAVRDLEEVRTLRFHFFAADVVPSHAYVHVVKVGGEVEVGGLKVKDGDLIHADLHGVVTVPLEIAREVPRACAAVEKRERSVIDLCRSPEFSLDALVKRFTGE